MLGGRGDGIDQLAILGQQPGLGDRRRQPAIETVTADVEEREELSERREQGGKPLGTVCAAFQALEIGPHRRRRPRPVPSEFCDGVPVRVIGAHRDHRVVGGAATDRRRARVEHAAAQWVILLVSPGLGFVVVVGHEEVPRHFR
jgi:hypothetical protein